MFYAFPCCWRWGGSLTCYFYNTFFLRGLKKQFVKRPSWMCVFKPRRDEASAAGSKSCVEWRLASPPHRASILNKKKSHSPYSIIISFIRAGTGGIGTNSTICHLNIFKPTTDLLLAPDFPRAHHYSNRFCLRK